MPSDERFTEEAWERATGRKYSLRAWQQETGYREFTLKGWTEFIRGLGRFAGGSAYHADAVHFDASDYLFREDLALTGVTNGSTGIISLWKKSSEETSSDLIYASLTSAVDLRDGGFLSVQNSGGSTVFAPIYTAGMSDGDWHHLLISWNVAFDTGTRICHIYKDDVALSADSVFESGSGPIDIDYEGETFWQISGNAVAGFDLADLYFAPGQFLDFSDADNRRKFIAARKPVDLGADGSTPTGTAPALFFSGDATAFSTNRGSGGAFTVNGALSNVATSPSD